MTDNEVIGFKGIITTLALLLFTKLSLDASVLAGVAFALWSKLRK
jgi:hypothetical protein